MSGYYGLIELLLVFGIVLGLGLWELRNLRRDSRAAGKTPSASKPRPADADTGDK